MKRIANIKRKTSETDITINLNLDGKGSSSIKTGIRFLDHMLELFSKHGLFDLKVFCKGDIDVDIHHSNEDVGIALGQAFKKALGSKSGIRRFASLYVPMDEALVRVVLDISGRQYLNFLVKPNSWRIGKFEDEDYKFYNMRYCKQFFKAFTDQAAITLHIDVLAGEDLHHIAEAVFKGVGLALKDAVAKDSRRKGVPSTKGRL